MIAVGVDGCTAGWVGVAIDESGYRDAVFAATIGELAAQVPDATGFGIDIPIGLLDQGFRVADLLARNEVGPRRQSVFMTPPRPVLDVASHAEASALAVRLVGVGISRQAHGLRRRIFEVDDWLDSAGRAVWEVHPEVSFSVLAGRHLAPKNSWNGAAMRRALLASAGISLPDDLGRAGLVTVDDILDAAVVARSCRRGLGGRARSLPDPPQIGPSGQPIAIWA